MKKVVFPESFNSPNPKTVVLWSGGVDSTGALYKILKDYPDEVFAHHIHFKNIENRWEVEKESVDKMIPWLRKNVRDFNYSESTFEIGLENFGWDIQTAMYIGGLVVKDKFCNKLVVGISGEDYDEDPAVRTYGRVWAGAYTISNLLAVIATLQHPQNHQAFPYIWQLMANTSKKEIWDSLPEFLKENTWSCRTPKQSDGKWVECEDCKTCISLKKLR